MKTRRSIRRILAVLLLIVMAFSILSESALAAPGGGGGTWGRYYYFRNETDASVGDNVKVYYSINGGSLQPIENGGSVSISEREAQDGSTAIVFYIYITDEAENSGVTFTTDNQAKTLRSITEEHGQAVIEGGNSVGDYDFSSVTNEAYDDYGCRYALYYSSFNYSQYGGNNYRGFQVWMNLPSQEERSWIVYHSNISAAEDTTRYQTIDSNTSSVTLWRAVYENEGYTLTGVEHRSGRYRYVL